MKLNQALQGLLSFFLTAMPLSALANLGGSDGGGGSAILCLKPNGQPKPSQLTDLVEATFYDHWNLAIPLQKLPWQRQVEIVITRIGLLDPEFNSRLRQETRAIVAALPEALNETKGTRLVFPVPSDLGSGRVPPVEFGCSLVGVAAYYDSDIDLKPKLSMSSFVWNSLPEMHKAALIVHEAVYRIERTPGRNAPRTSENVRRIVGLAFSSEFYYFAPELIQNAREKFQKDEVYYGHGLPWHMGDGPIPDDADLQRKISDAIEPFLSVPERQIFYFENLTDKDIFNLLICLPERDGFIICPMATGTLAELPQDIKRYTENERRLARFEKIERWQKGILAGVVKTTISWPFAIKGKQDFKDFLTDFKLN